MMNQRLLAIQTKRARLIERAAAQRGMLAAELRQCSRPIELIDRAIAALNIVKSHPEIIAGVMIALAIFRPRGVFRWARRGWALWQTFRWITKKVAA